MRSPFRNNAVIPSDVLDRTTTSAKMVTRHKMPIKRAGAIISIRTVSASNPWFIRPANAPYARAAAPIIADNPARHTGK